MMIVSFHFPPHSSSAYEQRNTKSYGALFRKCCELSFYGHINSASYFKLLCCWFHHCEDKAGVCPVNRHSIWRGQSCFRSVHPLIWHANGVLAGFSHLSINRERSWNVRNHLTEVLLPLISSSCFNQYVFKSASYDWLLSWPWVGHCK